MSSPATPRRATLLKEGRRALVSTLISMGITAVLLTVLYNARQWTLPQWLWTSALLAWAMLAGVHALITWLTFRGLAGDDLAKAVLHDRPDPKPRRHAWLTDATDAGSFTIQMAVLALIGVLALLLVGELRRLPLLIVLAAALVVLTWLDVLIVHAVHYARLDQASPQLQFPDAEAERAFSDYVYLATAVQTTYGVTDTVAATRRIRKAMTTHALLAYVFSTVLVALVVSMALTLGE